MRMSLKIIKPVRFAERILPAKTKQRQKADFRSVEMLHNAQNQGLPLEMKLCVPTLKGFVILKVEDIIVCEAEKNYTIFHLKDKKPVIASRPLLDYEKILKDNAFFRVHRANLINLQHVIEYQRGGGGIIIMSNGAEVEISRRKKEQFQSKIREMFWH